MAGAGLLASALLESEAERPRPRLRRPDLPTVTIVSYRLGGHDGVSVEAAKWAWAFGQLGLRVTTLAGAGTADQLLGGLAWPPGREPPTQAELDDALAGSDLVVVENLCSLPLNPQASAAVARALGRRPALLRHHDLAWQREGGAGDGPPPSDPCWGHVTINDLSRRQLATRGIAASTVYNAFAVDVPAGDRLQARRQLGVEPGRRLVLQPTRAIRRKNIPGALALAEALGADYWLLGPSEEGYEAELEAVLARSQVTVHRGAGEATIADAYAACDLVALPSHWEGFGNPAVESAVHNRPLAIGAYPVAAELAGLGFRWFQLGQTESLAAFLDSPLTSLLDHNLAVVRRRLSLSDLPARLQRLLAGLGWGPLLGLGAKP